MTHEKEYRAVRTRLRTREVIRLPLSRQEWYRTEPCIRAVFNSAFYPDKNWREGYLNLYSFMLLSSPRHCYLYLSLLRRNLNITSEQLLQSEQYE